MKKFKKLRLPADVKTLTKKADRLFQRARVLQECDEVGYAFCISCRYPQRKHHTQLDGGHFVSKGNGGSFFSVRYEKNNVWPQCISCNRFQTGNYSLYRDNLIKLIGRQEVERIEKKKYETVISKRLLLEKVISEWSVVLKELKAKYE